MHVNSSHTHMDNHTLRQMSAVKHRYNSNVHFWLESKENEHHSRFQSWMAQNTGLCLNVYVGGEMQGVSEN